MFRRIPAEPLASSRRRTSSYVTLALLTTLCTASLSLADDDSVPSTPPVPAAPATPPVPAVALPAASADAGVPAPTNPSLGKGFESPEAAAKALFAALEANDDVALRAIEGPGNDDIVQDGKDPIVASQRTALVAASKAKMTLETQADGRVVIVIGKMDYPMAIPLVAKDGVWRADAAAGRQELLARRVGENELEAIGVCLAYADAQVQYASKDRNDDGVKEYAQRLVSTPGDEGRPLTGTSAPGEEASPAGPDLTPFREALEADASPHRAVQRLLLADPHGPGRERAGRRVLLRHQRAHDRGLRAPRRPGGAPQHGRHVLPGQQPGQGLREGPGARHAQGRRRHRGVRPRPVVARGRRGHAPDRRRDVARGRGLRREELRGGGGDRRHAARRVARAPRAVGLGADPEHAGARAVPDDQVGASSRIARGGTAVPPRASIPAAAAGSAR